MPKARRNSQEPQPIDLQDGNDPARQSDVQARPCSCASSQQALSVRVTALEVIIAQLSDRVAQLQSAEMLQRASSTAENGGATMSSDSRPSRTETFFGHTPQSRSTRGSESPVEILAAFSTPVSLALKDSNTASFDSQDVEETTASRGNRSVHRTNRLIPVVERQDTDDGDAPHIAGKAPLSALTTSHNAVETRSRPFVNAFVATPDISTRTIIEERSILSPLPQQTPIVKRNMFGRASADVKRPLKQDLQTPMTNWRTWGQ